MSFCSNCGNQIADGIAFCPNCGTPCASSVNEGTTVLGQEPSFNEGTTVLGEEIPPSYNPPVNNGGNDIQMDNPYYQPQQPQPSFQQAPPVQQAPQQPQYQAPNPFGASATQQTNPFSQPATAQTQAPIGGLTFEEFFEKFASKKTKSNYKALAIIAVITAVASIASIFVFSNMLSILDVAFYAVMAFLLFGKKKNWLFPLITTCYAGFFSVLTMVSSGEPAGIVAAICGIFATIGTKKLNDAFNTYKSTGQEPTELL